MPERRFCDFIFSNSVSPIWLRCVFGMMLNDFLPMSGTVVQAIRIIESARTSGSSRVAKGDRLMLAE